jgi:hypothetical protein
MVLCQGEKKIKSLRLGVNTRKGGILRKIKSLPEHLGIEQRGRKGYNAFFEYLSGSSRE